MANAKPATSNGGYQTLSEKSQQQIPAPRLPYRPKDPESYNPPIGLIGCGGITVQHLRAYKAAGYQIVALCDIFEENARKRQQEFYPQADVYTNHQELLARDDIEVVDITTHPAVRPPLIEDALQAGKHVLSQKPFVLDLDVGEHLVEVAKKNNVLLAVNQNARWAPHFSYAREAFLNGYLGDLHGVHLSVRWDHRWVEGTPFATIKHLVLYDYAIHWFDFVNYLLFKEQPQRVYASTTRTSSQTLMPAMSASVSVAYPHTQVTIAFDAATPYGRQDSTYLAGSEGSLFSTGPNEKVQVVTLYTAEGISSPELVGSWFPDGFHGAMAELLCAVEEKRQATHSAEENLKSLAMCFSAIHSAETGEISIPGQVRKLYEDEKV